MTAEQYGLPEVTSGAEVLVGKAQLLAAEFSLLVVVRGNLDKLTLEGTDEVPELLAGLLGEFALGQRTVFPEGNQRFVCRHLLAPRFVWFVLVYLLVNPAGKALQPASIVDRSCVRRPTRGARDMGLYPAHATRYPAFIVSLPSS